MLTDDERERANEIRARLNHELEIIPDTTSLTPAARNRRRAVAIVEARQEMAELRAASDARHAGEAKKAYTAAFGIRPDKSAEDRAYRDQLAREHPNAGEAQRMMEQAIARGDTVAQTALAELAWARRHDPGGHWVQVLNDFGGVDERNDRAISNLIVFSEPDRREQMSDNLYTHITAPPDLPNVETLAAEAFSLPASAS